MKWNSYDSFLQFDFKVNQQLSPIQFVNPLEIISTFKIEEVNDCLQKINKAVIAGKYVAGYLSYEASYALYSVKNGEVNSNMPILWFGVYDSPAKFTKQKTFSFHTDKWQIGSSKDNYKKTFDKIMQELKRDTFKQINYTVPFYTTFTGDTFAYYKQLKNAQQSHYNAFLKIKNKHILSISPELFFHLNNNEITVKPMKGTVHRGKTNHEDQKLKEWLQTSKKNKLENDLSVQLMKNELNSIVIPNSITLTEKYGIEQFPTLYQMTSTIIGEISRKIEVTDIIRHLFPSVSITGTPKSSAINYIKQIEAQPRNVYCGAIGYITPMREAIFNVPIRTVVIDKAKGKATYNAGGAITLNSNVEEEYEEMITKTKILHTNFQTFQLLETIGLHDGKLSVLDLHLNRLKQSANYFNFNVLIDNIKKDLLNFEHTHSQGHWKIRLLTYITGKYSIEISPLEETNTNKFIIAKSPIDKENYFLYHKTTIRKMYEIHQVNHSEIFDTLLWNINGEITEFTIGNVVVNIDGELLTPPTECGLLPGTFRERLLQEGKIKEGIIFKEDLKKCTNIWLINSVRHWVEMSYQQ